MKRLLIFSTFIVASAAVFAQGETQSSTPDPLKVEKMVIDFGKIPQGKPVYTFFELTNTGSTPLRLENVSAACGCTTPEWDKEPIAPGATTKIKVGYNAATEGYFEKPVTIIYNGITKQVNIKGTVWRAPSGAAPANASIQFLKNKTL